jgi:hypothetical protein
MAALADAIAHINARELDANEAAIAACFPPPPAVPPEAQQQLMPFLAWCEDQRVRALPAKPASVAAFAQWQQDLGVSKEKVAATLSAIEALHFAASLGNPIATPLVRVTTSASTIEPPRSWAKDEKELFTGLPVEIQIVVARREKDRETIMRRAQNEAAELRNKLLRLQEQMPQPKSADNTEGITNMVQRNDAGWNGPQGSNDMEKDKLRKDESGRAYPKPVDILNKVDPSWKRNDGFSAPLDSKE